MSLPEGYKKNLDKKYISSKTLRQTSVVTDYGVVRNFKSPNYDNLYLAIDNSVKDSSYADMLPDSKRLSRFIRESRPITYKDNPELVKSLLASMTITNTYTESDDIKNRLTDYQTVVYDNYEVLKVDSMDLPISEIWSSGDFLSQMDDITNIKHEEIQNYIQTVSDNIDKETTQMKSDLEYIQFDEDGFKNFYLNTKSLKELKKPVDEWLESFKGNTQFFGNYTVYVPGDTIEMINFDITSIYNKTHAFLTADSQINVNHGQTKPTDYFGKAAGSIVKGSNLASRLSEIKSSRTRTYNNPFIEDMLKAGPNLYSNMFDVYLRFKVCPSYSNSSDTNMSLIEPKYYFLNLCPIDVYNTNNMNVEPNKVMQSLVEDVYALSVRTASVEIPMAKRGTFTRKFAGASCDIPLNEVDFSSEGSLSIDLDANEYVKDIFLSLSGFHRQGYVSNGSNPSTFNNYPFMSPARLGLENTVIDLIVSIHSLSPWNSAESNPYVSESKKSKISYVFEDVRFLGVSDATKFSREAGALTQITVPFIFKQLRQHYRIDNTSGSGIASNDSDTEYNTSFNMSYSSVLEEGTVS